MDKILELKRKLGTLVDQLGTEEVIADEARYTAVEKEIDAVQGQIDRASKQQARSAALARPVTAGNDDDEDAATRSSGNPIGMASLVLDGYAPRQVRTTWNADQYLRAVRSEMKFAPDEKKHFNSLGDQLLAVARHAVAGKDPHALDARLVRAPTGAGEVDPSAGGFLVQTDFATAVFARAYDMGQILSRTNKLSISTSSNSMKIPGVDETSRATGSRWGGVQSYWVGEGGTAANSKPKFRLIELDLKKLLANWYVSDEMLADAAVINSIANQAFAEEITFMVEDAIFRGTGSGQPMGILNSGATVSVAKETGQATKTVVYENVLKMFTRLWARSRANSVWYINQDVEQQLYSMTQIIGTAGVPVYLPANGISGLPYGTLFGRPVVPIEYADTLGSLGDITLLDLSQYVLADKGGVQAASSMHVAFLTDEMVFRITYRVDGEPIWHAPLTPYKGTATQSPFITLAVR